MKIPQKWCVKASNEEEEKLVNEYARTIEGDHWSDLNNYAKSRYLCVVDYKYYIGSRSIPKGFTGISFEFFRRYILKELEKTLELW